MKNKTLIKQILGISFYAMLSVVFFAGCTIQLNNDIDNTKGIIIYKFTTSEYDDNWRYWANYTDIAGNGDELYFIDTAYKHEIGDTLWLLSKKNY